ncbi:MAG: carbohydrate ABC transporter permease [Caldilineae bacterium]|nr:MAG: carbohydrate ABC transporter permease [Caldilineae bacterium]
MSNSRYIWRKRLGWLVEKVAVLFILLFIAFPIYWLLITAFKPEEFVYSNAFIFPPTLANFRAIFAGDPLDFKPYLLNSLVISTATVLLAIPLATMAAYTLSRYAFKGSLPLLIWFLTTQFLPPVVVVIPFFILFRRLGLVDTQISLIIINLSLVVPYAVWMLKGFVDALPTEIEEAAVVDGCNEFEVLRRITFPLMMPGVITTAVFAFIMSWNEFLYALVLTRDEATTMTVGLLSTQTHRGVQWEWMSAAGLLVMVPIFFLSLTIRNYFVEGMTMGAVK